MKKDVKLLGMAAMFFMTFASCTNDELRERYQGEEISFTTRVTRAVEMKKENLTEFKVYGLGQGSNSFFINGQTAKKGDNNIFNLEQSAFWPTGEPTVKYWAYAPTDITADVSMSAGSQIFNNFIPGDNIETQKDLVVAYTTVKMEDAAKAVPLQFHHALSQVEIKAHCPSIDKQVYIKGAWIVNVNTIGKLQFSTAAAAMNYIEWTSGTPGKYGISLDATQLGSKKESATPLLAGKTNMLLVPQTVKGYDFEAGSGAYILLLCRVETHHDGQIENDPEGGSSQSGPIYNDVPKNKHIHQLFPITKEYNSNAYGYTCVAVDFDWKSGKKYVYNLDFCGHTSGAGVYPPENLPEGLPEGDDIIEKPGDKDPGDPVLDNPIRFTVDVDSWSSGHDDGLEEEEVEVK